MCGNPFRIWDEVDGEFVVERIMTKIIGYDKDDLVWDENEGHEYLTLNQILGQVMEKNKTEMNGTMPFLRVEYESDLWGVIFEVGNHPEKERQWVVHGITKGYA